MSFLKIVKGSQHSSLADSDGGDAPWTLTCRVGTRCEERVRERIVANVIAGGSAQRSLVMKEHVERLLGKSTENTMSN